MTTVTSATATTKTMAAATAYRSQLFAGMQSHGLGKASARASPLRPSKKSRIYDASGVDCHQRLFVRGIISSRDGSVRFWLWAPRAASRLYEFFAAVPLLMPGGPFAVVLQPKPGAQSKQVGATI